MSAALKLWWAARTRREQILLAAMFALLGITILWLGLYRPLDARLSDARARHADAVVRLGEVRAGANLLGPTQRAGPAPGVGDLASLVTADARAAGFTAATVMPQGVRRVTVSIPAARPPALFGWIARLEARGIVVEQMSARANSDPTLAADITLVSGG
jgi:general secretion pathway protein M